MWSKTCRVKRLPPGHRSRRPVVDKEAVPSNGNPALYVQTNALTKRYGAITALDECSLGAERGEVFGLLGPNGSGKTTLLRLLMGFLRPTAGRCTIDSLDCYRQSVRVHSRVAYLPGDVRMFRRMRGHDALRFFCRIRAGVDLVRAHQMADRLGLDLSRPINQMSTGMRQKLALAITLAPQVAVLMLDEPTSNLDPTVRGEVMTMIAEARAEGRTVIFSSHVLSEVEHVCDRVAILQRGALAHTQVMSKLRRQHRIRARLTGPMPPVPADFDDQTEVHATADGRLTIKTPGDLSPLLGWLAELPLAEVEIEPISLQSVYERYHPSNPR